MNEIKPTWAIAQQISKRHTFISCLITVPLFLSVTLITLVTLKILGYAHPGVTLRHFLNNYRATVFGVMFFIHFIPVNYYAIMCLFNSNFKNFQLKIVSRKDHRSEVIAKAASPTCHTDIT